MTEPDTNLPTLLLWLEGPMQAWGVNSKFSRRTTLEFPTRSAVMGLILSAMGASGEQRELLAKFSDLPLTLISYARTKNQKAVPPELFLKDFHMVGSAYNDKDPWETLLIPKTCDQKKAVGGGAKLTYRYYLQDTAFAVIMAIPQDMKQTLHDALTTPYWDLSLGRKNCVPTEFIYQGIFDTQEQAYNKAQMLATEKQKTENFRIIEGKNDAGEPITVNDIPIQFGPHKLYRERMITKIMK